MSEKILYIKKKKGKIEGFLEEKLHELNEIRGEVIRQKRTWSVFELNAPGSTPLINRENILSTKFQLSNFELLMLTLPF